MNRTHALEAAALVVGVAFAFPACGSSDTRDVLSHATRQAARSYDDYFVVDVDAHVSGDHFWSEIIDLIDNDVLRQIGQAQNRGFA